MDVIRARIADGGLNVAVLGDDLPARLVGGFPGRLADGPDEIAFVAAKRQFGADADVWVMHVAVGPLRLPG